MFEVEKLVGARSEWEWEGRESSGIKRDATRNPWLRRDVRSLWTFWGKLELMRWGANQGMIWATNRSSWPAIHFDFFRHFLDNILLQAISVIGADKKATTWAKTRASRSHECQVGLYNNTYVDEDVRGCCWYLNVWGWVGSGGLCWRGWEKYCWCLRMGVGGGGPPFSQLVSRRQLPKRSRCIFEMFLVFFLRKRFSFRLMCFYPAQRSAESYLTLWTMYSGEGEILLLSS